MKEMSDDEDVSINKVPISKTFSKDNKEQTQTLSTQDQTGGVTSTQSLFIIESHSRVEMYDC